MDFPARLNHQQIQQLRDELAQFKRATSTMIEEGTLSASDEQVKEVNAMLAAMSGMFEELERMAERADAHPERRGVDVDAVNQTHSE
ncbi:MAG: hypothetical protein V4582_16790 [Pseudomonadota bacterium]